MDVLAKSRGVLYPKLLIFIGLVTALGPISVDIYLPVFPAISSEFGASHSLVQHTVLSFLMGIALGQMLYGPLSDRIGRKLPLCMGILLYIAASIGCCLAKDISTLVTWRFMQGAGGCAGIVIGRAMVRDHFGAVGAAKAFSLLMLIVAAGPMIAPLIGGWLAGFGWRVIFAVLALFGALLLVGAFYLVDETLPSGQRTHNQTSTAFGRCRVVLGSTRLLSYTVVAGLMQSALYAYVVSAPFVLMGVYGIDPQYFGLVFFANTAGLIVASQINAAIVERVNPDRVLGIALLWPVGFAIALIASLFVGYSSIYVVLAVLFGFLVAHGFISPNASALALSEHGATAGTASAIMGVIQSGLGIATIFITGILDATSALSLALVMGGCSGLAIACHRLIARPACRRP